jgi:hypothetical protein
MSGVVGAVTGVTSALVAGFITTTSIQEEYTIRKKKELDDRNEQSLRPDGKNEQPLSPDGTTSFIYSLVYSAASGIVCGTGGGIISDRIINDYGIVGGISSGIVAGIASGRYATRKFL